jgi:spore maturation protein CgeB
MGGGRARGPGGPGRAVSPFADMRRRLRVEREDAAYRRRAARAGLAYDPARVHERIDSKALAAALEAGKLRTFAAVRHHNWEGHNLIPALESLGEVVHFDWGAEGLPPDRAWSRSDKAAFNRLLLERFWAAHRASPVHLFFSYLSGRQVVPETIRAIGSAGTVTVNLSLDDRATFRGRRRNGARVGVSEIAPAFDACWTSTPSACEKYLVEGANPVFLPEGANPDVYRPLDLPFEYDVSFVGQCYGVRPALVAALEKRGIRVAAFGRGWPAGPLSLDDLVALYAKSRVNLGFGGVGGGDDFLCLKGRDFEVPMSGGLYLTRYNPELDLVYRVGEEIACYRDPGELLEKVQYLLAHPEEADAIRRAGHVRARRDHTWRRRMDEVLARLIGPR